MKYINRKERCMDASSTLDGQDSYDIDIASKIISDYTKIPFTRVKNCIINIGIKTLFDNPSLINGTPEQRLLLIEIRDLIDWGFDNTYESI